MIVDGERTRQRRKDLDDGENSIQPAGIEKVKRSGKQDWQDEGNMKDTDMLQ